MNNLIEEDEPEISTMDTIEKPKRKMSDKTREALAAGKKRAAEKKALDKTPKSIPEPILKKKVKLDADEVPVEKPKPKRKQKQVIVIQSDDDEDDDTPQIIIRTKSSKKADIPPPIPPVQLPAPQVLEPVEPEPKPIYRMRRI